MSVAETAARAAADLRAELAVPHTDGFVRNRLAAARISVARAIVRERLDPGVSWTAQRRYLASRAAYDDMMDVSHAFPTTADELLAAFDALAAGRQERAA